MLIRLPDAWPPVVCGALAMLALAALDLAGAVLAKEAVVRHSPAFGVAGVLTFAVLFWVYASSLQYAELAVVTLGWVVVLQVGVVVVDALRYGTPSPPLTWVVVGVLVAAQAYLLLAPPPSPAPGGPPSGVPAVAAPGPAR